ncbi:MAG: hypothetical protein EBY20_02015 [Alphaproteobacteria bacterium]|nr:hypothetical protein [Alphaproteobacteria bacterium]
MNQEFIDNVYYTPTHEELCYLATPPLPIPDTPNYVVAFAFGMFLLFCNEMITMTCGQGYNLLDYLEKKTSSYVKDQLDFYFYNENNITEEENKEKETDNEAEQDATDNSFKKYEDKYLEEFKKLADDIVLTEEEVTKEIEHRPASRDHLEKKLELEKDELKKKMEKFESQIKDVDANMMGDAENAPRKSEIILNLNRALKRLSDDLEKLNETIITEEDVNTASREFVINERLPAKQTAPQEEKVVKERANRYSFEGKLANFSFLKKVDRKAVDKLYGLSFAEFKKMQKMQQNK